MCRLEAVLNPLSGQLLDGNARSMVCGRHAIKALMVTVSVPPIVPTPVRSIPISAWIAVVAVIRVPIAIRVGIAIRVSRVRIPVVTGPYIDSEPKRPHGNPPRVSFRRLDISEKRQTY